MSSEVRAGLVDLDAAVAAIDRAYAEVGEIAKEGPARRWRMSIPAQPDRDSDLLIANALDAGRLVVAQLRVARAVVSSAGVASITVERLVNTLAKDRSTWDDDAIAMWDATQVLQRDLSLYRRATT